MDLCPTDRLGACIHHPVVDVGMDETTGDGAPVELLTPPIPKPVFRYLINPLIKALLRSPFHWLVSDALLLLTYTGRKSGRTYTTPVGYEERDGTLYVTSQTDRVWWKNLRGGAEVEVRLRGERRGGEARVLEDNEAVADYVLGFVDRHGIDSVSRLALSFRDDELPAQEALAAALDEVAVIEIELLDA